MDVGDDTLAQGVRKAPRPNIVGVVGNALGGVPRFRAKQMKRDAARPLFALTRA
jgi:hypothetical protein